MRAAAVSLSLAVFAWEAIATADTLSVGPGKAHATPCAAVAAAADGDRIEIDAAGDYAGDVCTIAKNGLTLIGVNGRPVIDAAGADAQGKGIWVISGDDTTVENVELRGATVPEGNGAGIRQEGTNLTVRRSYFHDNENGILSSENLDSTITIEGCELASNGTGDGLTHNVYIGKIGRLVFRFNYSHDANSGHLLKSRAAINVVAYNRLADGATDNSSYEVNLPSAGTSYVIGNVIEQGPSTENSAIIDYGSEPATLNATRDLYVVNNTVVNRRTAGATFVQINAAITTPAKLINNVFFGPGTVTNQAAAEVTTNYTGDDDPGFVAPDAHDFRLAEGSPCVNAGTLPTSAGDMSLVPEHHYVHPASSSGRSVAGAAIDIGAYELGGDVPVPGDGGTSTPETPGATPPGAAPPGSSAAPSGGGGDDDDGGCRAAAAPIDRALGGALLIGLALVLRRRRVRSS